MPLRLVDSSVLTLGINGVSLLNLEINDVYTGEGKLMLLHCYETQSKYKKYLG